MFMQQEAPPLGTLLHLVHLPRLPALQQLNPLPPPCPPLPRGPLQRLIESMDRLGLDAVVYPTWNLPPLVSLPACLRAELIFWKGLSPQSALAGSPAKATSSPVGFCNKAPDPSRSASSA